VPGHGASRGPSPGGGIVRDVRRNEVAANSQGQVAFWSRLKDGREAVIVATPEE